MEADVGTRLDRVAVDHWNTDNMAAAFRPYCASIWAAAAQMLAVAG